MEVTMKATDDLRNEHQGIELMLRILQAIAGKLGQGEQIGSGQLNGIMNFRARPAQKSNIRRSEYVS